LNVFFSYTFFFFLVENKVLEKEKSGGPQGPLRTLI
jgi:hypothetical protein